MSEEIVQIQNMELIYKTEKAEYEALKDITLTIHKGEFVCIIGPSGCGKSTLLSVLEGLIQPSKGKVLIDGHEIQGPGAERAVVFQNYSLFPWMTAKSNVAFAIRESRKETNKISKKEAMKRAETFLHKVGLEGFENKRPNALSGGMQQRVAIARALACNPKILLMDEPFSAIDARTREKLQQMLLELWMEEDKKTIVFVTHDLDEALLLADKIVFMLPKRIHNVIDVNIERPRTRETLIDNEEYRRLHKKLVRLFYSEQISGETDKCEV